MTMFPGPFCTAPVTQPVVGPPGPPGPPGPRAPDAPVSILELGPYNWTGALDDPAAPDATLGLNAMIAAAQSNGTANWFFPPSNYIFKTVPNWIENVPYFKVSGLSEYKTQLFKSFPSTVGTNQGIFRVRANGVDIMDMTLIGLAPSQVAGVGTGCLICYSAHVDFPIGYGHIERLNLTSGAPAGQAYIFTDLYMDGIPHALGIRAIEVDNVKFFGAESASMILDNVVAFTAKGPGTFGAGGKTGRIFISGAPGKMSSYINLDFAVIGDGLQTLQTQDALIKASFVSGNITHDATSSCGVITVGSLQNCSLGTMGPGCFHIGGAISGGSPPSLVKGAAVPIDSGSNAIGYWRKYGDGVIEQSFFVGPLTSGVPQAFTFPIPFPNGVFTSINATASGGGSIAIAVDTQTATTVTLIANGGTNAWISVRGT